jgi:hypothetical protein
MKARRLLLVLAFLVLIHPSTPAESQSPTSEAYYTFYSDAAFQNWVGECWTNLNCTGENGSVGSTAGPYRKYERFSCILENGQCHCQQLISGTWRFIDCPPNVPSGCVGN